MQQSFFESSGGAGNWPCHADRIELRGNFMTASWDDWITAPLSITPSALCAVSSLLSLPLASLRVFHDVSFSFLHFSPLLRLLLARGSFINVTSLYRRVHKIQLSGCRDEFFFLLNRGSFSRPGWRCCGKARVFESEETRSLNLIHSICFISRGYDNK